MPQTTEQKLLKRLNAYCPQPVVADASNYGTVGDGVTDDTAAIQSWLDADADEYYLPAGTYLVSAAGGLATGVFWDSGDGKTKTLKGESSATSIIKRAASATLELTSSMLWMRQREGAKYRYRDIQFDSNEQNLPVDTDHPRYPYEHEQSAAFKFLGGSGKVDEVDMRNVHFKDLIADGYHANVETRDYKALNITAEGRTRRPRADIQLSRIPEFDTLIQGCILDALETEPPAAPATNSVVVKDCLVRGAWDFGADTGLTFDGAMNLTADNVTVQSTAGIGLPFFNLYGTKGTLSNCDIRGWRRVQRCQVVIQDSTLRATEKDDPAEGSNDFEVWNDLTGSTCEFLRCDLRTEAANKLGYYFRQVSATNDITRQLIVRDCTVIDTLERVALLDRIGTAIIDGGNLSATNEIVSFGHGSGNFVVDLTVQNIGSWIAPKLLQFGSISGPVTVRLAGTFDADNQVLTDQTLTNANLAFSGELRGSISGPPDSFRGLPGVILVDGELEYEYTGNANQVGAQLWTTETPEL